MKYRNKKTGQVIEVKAYIAGGNWELVEAPKKPAETDPVQEKKGKKK